MSGKTAYHLEHSSNGTLWYTALASITVQCAYTVSPGTFSPVALESASSMVRLGPSNQCIPPKPKGKTQPTRLMIETMPMQIGA